MEPAPDRIRQYKPNWDETRRHFVDWWAHRGLVVGAWNPPRAERPIEDVEEPPPPPADRRGLYCDAGPRAHRMHRHLAGGWYGLDILPVAVPEFGPGSLGTFLGAEPNFGPDTVWYEHPWANRADPESLPPLRLDGANRWWLKHLEVIDAMVARAGGRFLVGCPDLVENMDVLAALRGGMAFLQDLIDRPAWVERILEEINHVWFAAYQQIYDRIRLPDGSSVFWAFLLWGPGKVAKLQCDASAMFGPGMFRRFVLPPLTRQCQWLDHSCYHLDGTAALMHLDALLEIEALDAIEWTPEPKAPPGGDRHWHDLYRRIKSAGKSVLVVQIAPDQVAPLLDAVGPAALYLQCAPADQREAEALARQVEKYR